MALKSVIFDFDGTIVDSFAAMLGIGNRLAEEFDFRPVQAHEVDAMRSWSFGKVREHMGIPWRKVPAIVARARVELGKQIEDLSPVEGLPEVLYELKASGLSLGILTSNNRDNVDKFLAAQNIDAFDFVRTSSGLWGKKQRLRTLLRRRGLEPEEAAYVGDEVRDVVASKALCMRAVAVSWGYSNRDLLAAEEPDCLIDHPRELLNVAQD